MPSPTKTKEQEEDDAIYADVGIMFEGAHATTLKHYEWPRVADDSDDRHISSPTNGNNTDTDNSNTKRPIHVALHVVDDEPGAVQSGHYLWPASPALCEYLIQNVVVKKNNNSGPKAIVELGAGCALVSLAALQLFQDSLQCVVITDHDPGTLTRAKDNHETSLEELYERAETEEEQMDVINNTSSIPVAFVSVEWGGDLKELKDTVVSNGYADPPLFDLVLGSDLIYCVEVVAPLMQTAAELLSQDWYATFFLSQSFVYDPDTEEEIDRMCDKLQLERVVLQDELSTKGARIQEFKRKQKEENDA